MPIVVRRLSLSVRCLLGALALACAGASAAEPPAIDGWKTEPGVAPPSYAVTEPIDGNLNIDIVALVCGESEDGRALQLGLYLSGEGPLLPEGGEASELKDTPSVEIAVDDAIFPARLLFSDDFVVVTDAAPGREPVLSQKLLDALQHGATMVVRFDLVRESAGMPPMQDGLIVVDLVRGHGAIAAVRRCASLGAYQASR